MKIKDVYRVVLQSPEAKLTKLSAYKEKSGENVGTEKGTESIVWDMAIPQMFYILIGSGTKSVFRDVR